MTKRGRKTILIVAAVLIVWNIFDLAIHVSRNFIEPYRFTGNFIGIAAGVFALISPVGKYSRLVSGFAAAAIVMVNSLHAPLRGFERFVAVFIGLSLLLLILMTQLQSKETSAGERRKVALMFRKWWMSIPAAVTGLAVVFGFGSLSDPAAYRYMSLEQSDTTPGSSQTPGQQGEVLSAFFGLDDGLIPLAENLVPGATGLDGMPVVFSEELDIESLQAGDFRVTTESGTAGYVHGVTLAPAVDFGELRTVLLVGQYGSADRDPPARVEIVGNLFSKDTGTNFNGTAAEVIPLEDGPTLVYASVVPEENWYPGRRPNVLKGAGSGTPRTGVVQVVRVTWAGGVSPPGGGEPGDKEMQGYTVVVQAADGSTREVKPIALADLGDADNNHLLCLDTGEKPLEITFEAGLLVDPNDDLNPATAVRVSHPR